VDPRITQLIAADRLQRDIRTAAAAREAKTLPREDRKASQPAARRGRFVRRAPTSTTPTR
jgi:hypothetical protein